jgi:hypothetical protein
MDLAHRISKIFFRCKTSQMVRFEIPVVVSVENIVFWGVTPCGLVDSYHHFWWNVLSSHIPEGSSLFLVSGHLKDRLLCSSGNVH